jgi:hypothetical protein
MKHERENEALRTKINNFSEAAIAVSTCEVCSFVSLPFETLVADMK